MVGPANRGDGMLYVAVLFPGNKDVIGCNLTNVRRPRAAPTANPPAYAPHTRRCSAHAPHGPSLPQPDPWVAAPMRGAAEPYLLTLYAWLRAQVSRDPPPPLPGGYKVGEKVFYAAPSKTFPNGEKVVHGQQGEVSGPATLETCKGKGVKVVFPGNTGWTPGSIATSPRYAASARLCATHATLHACASPARGPSLPQPDPTASHCGGGSAGEGPCRTAAPLPLVNARR